MAAGIRPPAEVVLDESLVGGLLAEQHPDLAGLPLAAVDAGWDNFLFRLGDELVVRLPRRAASAGLVLNEQRWLPELAPRLPLEVPVALRLGRPGVGYPWHWSVCPWFEGTMLASGPSHDPAQLASDLGGFFGHLHTRAPGDAPRNPWRGIPLADRAEHTRGQIRGLEGDPGLGAVELDDVEALWESLWPTPAHAGPPVWLHGDPHPANLLVSGGRLAAVLDWGDVTSGDPASDLASAWMALPPGQRPVLREAAGEIDDDTWVRARGWALALAVAMLTGSADDSIIRGIGLSTLLELMADS